MRNSMEASLLTSSGDPLVLKGVTAEGDCRGLLFEATVVQRYVNPTRRNVEVVYNFPLPFGAVLLSVDVVLGGKSLTGSVVAKAEADVRYEDAIAQGDAAIMLEQTGDGGYCMNLGNLAAREACVITLRYAQALNFEQSGLRLMIPTVIAPRYGDPLDSGHFAPQQVYGNDLTAQYPFNITLRLHGDLARARISCPSHRIGVETSTGAADGATTITLAQQGALDRDFVLVIDRLAHRSLAITARDYADASQFVTLLSLCPTLPESGPGPVAMKILVDCSGSMSGDSMTQASRALLSVVGELDGKDRFSLSRFGSTIEHRSRALWAVTPATKRSAQRWIENLQADLGGTEMEQALSSTIRLGDSAPGDILLITDGEIHGIESLIEVARQSGHRIFVVGIGSSPAEGHLRRLAQATGGGCDFVAAGEAVHPAILRMFVRLRSPRLQDLKLVWPDHAEILWSTPLDTAVFPGDTMNLYAWTTRPLVGRVSLFGRNGDTGKFIELASATSGVPCVCEALSRLAASTRIGALQGDEAEASSDTAALTHLAVKYQLVTRYSNFLLVHARAQEQKATGMPDLIKVAQMVPAGWGGTGSVSASEFLSSPAVSSSMSLNVPSVLRNPRSGSDLSKSSAMFDASTGYDIPAFLRRQSDSDFNCSAEPMSERIAEPAYPLEIDRANPGFWIQESNYIGMTPLGVAELLHINPSDFWPSTYRDYADADLGQWLIEWLELAIGGYGGFDRDEQLVVAAFNHVMGQPETRSYLQGKISEAKWLQAIDNSLMNSRTRRHPALHSPEGQACGKRIAAILAHMRPRQWPDQVMNLVGDGC